MTPIIYASLSCLCSKIKFQSDGSCICFNSGSQLPWSCCSFCLCWHWASFFIFTILTVIQHQCFLVEFRIFLSFSCRSHCFFFLNILFHLNLSMYFVFFYPRIFFIYPLTLIYKEIIHVLRCFKQIYSCIVWSECLVTHISLPNRRSQCQPSKTENYIIYGWQDFQTTQYFIF